jgi:hypothetical protein
MILPSRLLLLSGLLAFTATAQEDSGTNWVDSLHLTASATAGWTNNHSRTSAVATRKDSDTYEFSLGGSQPRQLAPSLLLITSEEISALRVQDFHLADHLRVGGRLVLQRKFGLGPLAPVLQVSGGLAYKSARFEGDRGWTTEAGLQFAKRILPGLRLAVGAQWLEHSARSNVFDLVQHAFSGDVSWDVSDRWSLAASVSRLEGDIVANAAWPVWAQALGGGFGPVVQNYYTSRPWSRTHLYGPDWVSYNVEADVDLWSASLSYRASDRTTLELRKSAAFVVNRIGVRYPTDTWSLGLHHRF